MVTALLYSSCKTFTYYHPVNHIAPVLEDKGDIQLFGGVGTSDYFQHGNFQFTYALDSIRFISGNGLFNINKPEPAYDNNMQKIGNYFKSSYYYDLGYGKKIWQSYDMNLFLQGTVGLGNTYKRSCL